MKKTEQVDTSQLMPPALGPHVEQRKLPVQFLFPWFSPQCSAAVQYRLQWRLTGFQSLSRT